MRVPLLMLHLCEMYLAFWNAETHRATVIHWFIHMILSELEEKCEAASYNFHSVYTDKMQETPKDLHLVSRKRCEKQQNEIKT